MQGSKVFAMVIVIFTIYILHCGAKRDWDFINYLENKCPSFTKLGKILLEYDFYNNVEHLAYKTLYNLSKMRKNNPSIFLISKTFLDGIWTSQYKDKILEFMLEPQTLLLLMDDVSERVLKLYSAQLLQKNVSKVPLSELYTYTLDTLELYLIKTLLTQQKEKPQGKFCVQTNKLEFGMNELIKDFAVKTKISETQEDIAVRKRKLNPEETKIEEKPKKTKKRTKKKGNKANRIQSCTADVTPVVTAI